MIKKFFGSGMLLAILCLLSACWVSKEPLLNAANSDPVDFAGRYRSISEEDSWLVIEKAEDGAYLLFDDELRLKTYFLKATGPVQGRWYILQYEARDEDMGEEDVFYFFQPLLVAEDGTLRFYEPECGEDVEGIGEIRGVDASAGACEFTSLKALRRVALDYIERVESGAPEAEPNVFVPDDGA